MSNDILKKPVHAVILEPSHVQKLEQEGKLKEREFAVETPKIEKLPAQPKSEASILSKKTMPVFNLQKSVMAKTRLKIIHDNVPKLPADKKPPCDTCQTSACCHAFLVTLTKEEYESGIYGKYAVKFSVAELEQLQGKMALLARMRAPIRLNQLKDDQDVYYLEGSIGEACPFLLNTGQCGIYDRRPITCRIYSCVDDVRITQDMRDGNADIEKEMIEWMLDLHAK